MELNALLDIPITMSVEVGKTKQPIRSLLSFNQGSVIELDKLSSEPLELKVNGKVVATGEVVVVNNRFGFRILNIIAVPERLKYINNKSV
jgi:flagellar motor switch protein FliN/FliY